jgi:hypothetical protein
MPEGRVSSVEASPRRPLPAAGLRARRSPTSKLPFGSFALAGTLEAAKPAQLRAVQSAETNLILDLFPDRIMGCHPPGNSLTKVSYQMPLSLCYPEFVLPSPPVVRDV